MRAARFSGLFLAILIAGCGGVKPAPPGEPPKSSAAQAGTAAPVVPPPAPPTAPPPPAAAQSAPAVAQQAQPPAAPPTGPATSEKIAKAAPKAPPAPAPAAQAPKKEAAPAQAAKPQAPPLDLNSLETRLKDTKAIGVLTKIALKNQVDDLLNQFRAYYQGKLKTTLAELRKPYDLLVLKVLSLLQDSDPSLAGAIVASREAIWGILSDPVKFAAAI
jgi:type IV secretory pathway VirB10-like protein